MKKFYINELLKLENVFLDYPFPESEWAAIRHCDNKKIFALIYEYKGKICINFKNSPDWATFWRGTFQSVQPAYHMNKERWSMVYTDGDAGYEQIIRMITDSYNLTKKRKKNEQKTEKCN